MWRAQKKWFLGGGLFFLVVVAIAAGMALHRKALATPHYLKLADGSEAFFLGDTKITPAAGYPQPRELHVDGDVFLRIADQPEPLKVRSRLLILTVTGKSAFRMTAYAKEAGEQAEVLYGNVTAHKSYESTYKEPDVLTAGEMTMINRDIDLMEKEKADLGQLRAWSDALVALVTKHAQ